MTGSTEKAGISFEFVDFLTSAAMNSTGTNADGWAATDMRAVLNGGTKHDGTTTVSEDSALVNTLKNASYIKSVSKKYIQTYNDADSIQTCDDKLWLLACGEIWDNGYSSSLTTDRGYAIADESPEGKQYAYYKKNLKGTAYNSSSEFTKKYSSSASTSASWWWLRSPCYGYNHYFCSVGSGGGGNGYTNANSSGGVAPGFSI